MITSVDEMKTHKRDIWLFDSSGEAEKEMGVYP